MAIVVQQNREQGLSSFLYIIAWIIFIFSILIGAYYIFFKKPELYESALPLNQNDQARLNDVLKAKSYVDFNAALQMIQSLRNYIDFPKEFNIGKENPFF